VALMQTKLQAYDDQFSEYGCEGRVMLDACFPDGY